MRDKICVTPTICRYCGGVIRLTEARIIYGDAVKKLDLEGEKIYLCQNCNARVGCHKGTTRPKGNVATEVLRLKRIETPQVFDAFWRARGMSRTQGYQWLAQQMGLSEKAAHIGGFEMDACERVITLCREYEKNKEVA